MFQLSDRNLESFAVVAHEQMRLRICAWLRRNHPRLTAQFDDKALAARVTPILQSANRYGIRGENALIGFVVLALRNGDDFHLGADAQIDLQKLDRSDLERVRAIWRKDVGHGKSRL